MDVNDFVCMLQRGEIAEGSSFRVKVVDGQTKLVLSDAVNVRDPRDVEDEIREHVLPRVNVDELRSAGFTKSESYYIYGYGVHPAIVLAIFEKQLDVSDDDFIELLNAFGKRVKRRSSISPKFVVDYLNINDKQYKQYIMIKFIRSLELDSEAVTLSQLKKFIRKEWILFINNDEEV